MVGADKAFGVANISAAYLGAAMWARVEQNPGLAIFAAGKNDWIEPHLSSDVITGIGDFRVVADIEPGLGKDLFLFYFKNGLVGENEPAGGRVLFIYKALEICRAE